MKKTILILIILLGCTNLALADCTDKDSAYKCKKMLIIDDEGNKRIDLNCTLPKIQTLTIKAQDVIDNEGNFKEYWDKKTVCDVLGWMNGAVEHIEPNYDEGLKTNFTQTMDLEFKPVERNKGGGSGKSGMYFDSERPYLFSDDGTSNFHWLRMHFIVVHEFAHFIEKNSQAKTHSGIPAWVEEGRAKDFEDIVYDAQNPYSDVSTSYKMYEQGIANVLNDKGLTKYEYPNFVFFKALRNKCGKIKMGLLMNKKPDLTQATDGCTGIPKVGKDDLAGLFTLYNWAMLYKQDLSLLDANEPARPNDKIFDGEYKKIDEKDFSESINIRDEIGTLLPPFSAKSFLITHETLEGDADMNLTFESNASLKLVAIRVKTDGSSSNVNDKFVMSSNDTAYDLTELDREGGLFITLVNTTGEEIKLDELKLEKKGSNTTATLAFYYVYNCAGEVAGLKFKVYTTKNEESKLIHSEDYANFYAENREPDNSWIIDDTNILKDENLYASEGTDTIGGWHGKVFFQTDNKAVVQLLLNNNWTPELYRFIEVNRGSGGWGGIGSGGHFIGGGGGDRCSLPVLQHKVVTVRMPSISIDQIIIDKILEEF